MLTESEILAYTTEIPADIQRLKSEPPVVGSATDYAALVANWKSSAKGWADCYVRLRGMNHDAAQRASVRVEVYEQCVHDLEEVMRHNA